MSESAVVLPEPVAPMSAVVVPGVAAVSYTHLTLPTKA